jgi:hypothetical protein
LNKTWITLTINKYITIFDIVKKKKKKKKKRTASGISPCRSLMLLPEVRISGSGIVIQISR